MQSEFLGWEGSGGRGNWSGKLIEGELAYICISVVLCTLVQGNFIVQLVPIIVLVDIHILSLLSIFLQTNTFSLHAVINVSYHWRKSVIFFTISEQSKSSNVFLGYFGHE